MSSKHFVTCSNCRHVVCEKKTRKYPLTGDRMCRNGDKCAVQRDGLIERSRREEERKRRNQDLLASGRRFAAMAQPGYVDRGW